MRLGYNTNGFGHHTLEDALSIIAEIGYECAAVTLTGDWLNPPERDAVPVAIDRLGPLLERHGLTATIETGARHILDPQRKHQPTMISAAVEGRQRRVEFLCAAIEVAAGVGAESVSFWSGAADDDADEETLWSRLTESLKPIIACAGDRGVRLAFEPEPGMLIDTMAQFEKLEQAVGAPHFGLTLDLGHVHCLRDGDPADHIRSWKHKLWNVHIEDMRRDRHEHLLFGEGDMDFPPILAALREISYPGPVHVELSRHGHDAENAARRSHAFLGALLGKGRTM